MSSPVGRRAFLTLLGLGAAGIAVGARVEGWLERTLGPVIARDPTGVLHTVVLGIGTDDGVKVGHVVLSDQGLVGRVSEVGTNRFTTLGDT